MLQTIGQHILSQTYMLEDHDRKLRLAVHEAVNQRSLQIQQSQDLAAARSLPSHK